VACGTGVDSIMLLEEGFEVVSTDASDKMLKYALKERWNRRKEPSFDKWIIEEANWLTLKDDLDDNNVGIGGFDAVICLGNSFAHLPDFQGEQQQHKIALSNFESLVKPGGILIIDHRNYDAILKYGRAPSKNVYYNSEHIEDIKTSNLFVNGQATLITLDYVMDLSSVATDAKSRRKLNFEPNTKHKFRLSYYPHQLEGFNKIITSVFSDKSQHKVYGDFKPLGEIDQPAYYIHVVEKA